MKKKSINFTMLFILGTLLLQTGCSSMGKSVGLGSAIGAGTGAVGGHR